MADPTISVIFRVYNESPEILTQALESILGQTFRDFEVIVADDSTDLATIACLAKLLASDPRARRLARDRPFGRVGALNAGLAESRGEYIAPIDADDVQFPARFATQLEYLARNPEVDILGSWCVKITGRGERQGIRRYPRGGALLRAMMMKNAIAQPSVLMRRSVIESIGEYDDRLQKAEDYELWMRAIKSRKVLDNVQQPLIYYRVSDSTKRDIVNWKTNLLIKLRYFDLHRLPYRLAGVGVGFLMTILPEPIVNQFYRLYNRYG